MSLSQESKAAFMRAAALLAQGRTAAERQVIFRNAQHYADAGAWIPAITAEQFPLLFYPDDPKRQADLADRIRLGQEAGELSKPAPAEPQGLWPLQWAAWSALPPVPVDSPLVHWLPDWVPREPTAKPDPDPQVQRQARRYQMCVDAGLEMPTDDYSQLPRGIGKLAEAEDITRQAFAEDLKAHIRRLNSK